MGTNTEADGRAMRTSNVPVPQLPGAGNAGP